MRVIVEVPRLAANVPGAGHQEHHDHQRDDSCWIDLPLRDLAGQIPKFEQAVKRYDPEEQRDLAGILRADDARQCYNDTHDPCDQRLSTEHHAWHQIDRLDAEEFREHHEDHTNRSKNHREHEHECAAIEGTPLPGRILFRVE